MTKHITLEQFHFWFGSDHYERWQDLTELILELLNTEYSIDSLREDIKSYYDANY